MGYNDEFNSYWDNVKNYLIIVLPNLIKICCTDNNGQISNGRNSSTSNLIGKWAIANNSEKDNGDKSHDCCIQNDLSCNNTHFTPKRNDVNNLATWYDNNGELKRHIDYCAISPQQRNWIQRIKINKIENTRQCTHQRMLHIYLQIKLKYPDNLLADANYIKFNVNELRKYPNI